MKYGRVGNRLFKYPSPRMSRSPVEKVFCSYLEQWAFDRAIKAVCRHCCRGFTALAQCKLIAKPTVTESHYQKTALHGFAQDAFRAARTALSSPLSAKANNVSAASSIEFSMFFASSPSGRPSTQFVTSPLCGGRPIPIRKR